VVPSTPAPSTPAPAVSSTPAPSTPAPAVAPAPAPDAPPTYPRGVTAYWLDVYQRSTLFSLGYWSYFSQDQATGTPTAVCVIGSDLVCSYLLLTCEMSEVGRVIRGRSTQGQNQMSLVGHALFLAALSLSSIQKTVWPMVDVCDSFILFNHIFCHSLVPTSPFVKFRLNRSTTDS